jgi:glycerol-3-phosphate dehydrogenase subunit B
MAALAAATSADGADVALLRAPDSPFDRHAGLVGLYGYEPGDDEPVVDPIGAIRGLPDDHPYSVLGVDALDAGLALFDDAAGGQYAGGDADTNALLPSALGTPTPAARYPAATGPGLLSREDSMLLVGFPDLPDFRAPFVADRLDAAGVPFDVEGVTTTGPASGGGGAPAVGIAEALDDAAAAEAGPYSTVATVGRRVEGLAEDHDRVGFPAVLGLDSPAAVHGTLVERLEAAVFEVPLGPPSVLGRRLEATLDAAIRAAGGRVLAGTADGLRMDGDRIEGVSVGLVDGEGPGDADETQGGLTLQPGAAVLATGGPAEGGIVADRESVFEPLAGCHVLGETGPVRAAPDPFGAHPFARYGVHVDGDARPLTAAGEPTCEALFAAGAIIGGHDAVAEGSRQGVAIASGARAGARAVEVATRR